MSREWRDIRGFEGRYQVSNDGFVRSLPHIDRRGCKRRGRILKPGLGGVGYFTVNLPLAGGGCRSHSVHRLVAEAFIPNPEGKRTVNHKDGCRTNNNQSNLEWMTYSQNHLHSYARLGRKSWLTRPGGVHPSLRPVIGIYACGKIVRFNSVGEAAKSIGVDHSAISQAIKRSGRSGGVLWVYE